MRARDGHCRFPGCTTPARSCDLDHVVPFDHEAPDRGGVTEPDNLACLCRWHHRMKTEGHWQVRMEPAGTVHWTGPDGRQLQSVPTGLPPAPEPPRPEPCVVPVDPLSDADDELLVDSLVRAIDRERSGLLSRA